MVLLKEISEGIWGKIFGYELDIIFHILIVPGLVLGPNNTSEVVTDHPFRLTMAALDLDGKEMIE